MLGFILLALFLQSLTPLYSATSSNGLFCSGSSVSCTSGFVPSCSDPNYKPTCIGSPDSSIDCCKNTGFSLDCKSELPVCKAAPSSSSSSSSGSVSIKAYCLNDMVYCSSGFPAGCLDISYTPTCLQGSPSTAIECCKNNGISLYCRTDLLLDCPLVSDSLDLKFKTINISVVSNPKLPDVIELPLVSDAFVSRAGFAYVGSNPSFEIKLPTGDSKTTVATVDLKDSSDFIFNAIPFSVTPISGQPEKYILSLSIPDSVKEGESRFALNLSDGTFLSGVIYIFAPLDISVFKGKSIKTKQIAKPLVTRLSINKSKNNIILNIRGINFLGRSFLYKDSSVSDGDEGTLIKSPKGISNSTVTIFPSSLKAEIKKITVSSNRKQMKVNFKLPLGLDKKTNSIIVISTPTGIASRLFTLKPGFNVPPSQTIKQTGEAFCSGQKVNCTNGLVAICTNSDYSPKCLAGYPLPIPDCCRDDGHSFYCRAFLLKCVSK